MAAVAAVTVTARIKKRNVGDLLTDQLWATSVTRCYYSSCNNNKNNNDDNSIPGATATDRVPVTVSKTIVEVADQW